MQQCEKNSQVVGDLNTFAAKINYLLSFREFQKNAY